MCIRDSSIPSRHLGLYTPGEIQDLGERVEKLADALEQYADVDRLLELAQSAPPLEIPEEQEALEEMCIRDSPRGAAA